LSDRPHVEANEILFMNIPAFSLALDDEGMTRDKWRLRRALIEHLMMRVMERHQVPPAIATVWET